MTIHDCLVWESTSFQNDEGSLSLTFIATQDGVLFSARPKGSAQTTSRIASKQPIMELSVRLSSLFLRAHIDETPLTVDIEDVTNLADGSPHDVTMTFGAFGTRFYIDGYQCFSCATNLHPCKLSSTGSFTTSSTAPQLMTSSYVKVSHFVLSADILSPAKIASSAHTPIPTIEFSAAYLAQSDIATLQSLTSGTIYARFRVRGPQQSGTLLAVEQSKREVFSIAVNARGVTVTTKGSTSTTYGAKGSWDDGEWHDLIVRAARGAIDIYMDANHELHQPGQVFFGNYPHLSRITLGENTHGVRLMGEIRNGGIFTRTLNDSEIKKLSHAAPLTTTALYDKGFMGSASYRIPSLITTPRGVLIAGADQRVYISNDAPNKINFVIRRSKDFGNTWLPLQTVLSYPGNDLFGACAIDSCMVCDRRNGRVIVLIDHYPGGIGLINSTRELGVNSDGCLILEDGKGQHYILLKNGFVAEALTSPDGTTLTSGAMTSYRVDKTGNVTFKGNPAGNIYLKKGTDPQESLLEARTGFVVEIHSDDDGVTWSRPRQLNQMIKEPWMHFIGTCPGNGIQLHSAKYNGRILIPYYCTGESTAHYSSGALISDDGGKTWKRGKALTEGKVINGATLEPATVHDDDASTSESVFVEREDGTVVGFARNQNHSGLVAKAFSSDGGESRYSLEFDSDLPDIFSQPNAITLPSSKFISGPNNLVDYSPASQTVIFANASQMLPYRGSGVLRLSADGAQIWVTQRCFNPYHYGYQCMSVLPSADNSAENIGLLWERETAGVYFTRIPLTWLGVGTTAEHRLPKF